MTKKFASVGRPYTLSNTVERRDNGICAMELYGTRLGNLPRVHCEAPDGSVGTIYYGENAYGYYLDAVEGLVPKYVRSAAATMIVQVWK